MLRVISSALNHVQLTLTRFKPKDLARGPPKQRGHWMEANTHKLKRSMFGCLPVFFSLTASVNFSVFTCLHSTPGGEDPKKMLGCKTSDSKWSRPLAPVAWNMVKSDQFGQLRFIFQSQTRLHHWYLHHAAMSLLSPEAWSTAWSMKHRHSRRKYQAQNQATSSSKSDGKAETGVRTRKYISKMLHNDPKSERLWSAVKAWSAELSSVRWGVATPSNWSFPRPGQFTQGVCNPFPAWRRDKTNSFEFPGFYKRISMMPPPIGGRFHDLCFVQWQSEDNQFCWCF